MDTFTLKMIAITAMLIDHIGAIVISENHAGYWPCRIVGRLAFPIFAFLLVEGFHHTRDVKKYLVRLGVFAVISEIPFDIAFYRFHNHEDILGALEAAFSNHTNAFGFLQLKIILNNAMLNQNIFFTLFLGLLLITCMSWIQEIVPKKFPVRTATDGFAETLEIVLNSLLVFAFCYLAEKIRCDYSYAGVLLIVAIYLFEHCKPLLAASMVGIFWIVQDFSVDRIDLLLVLFACLSIVLMALYNGKKGKDIKYFFYIFYPAHLLFLFLIRTFL
jgi:hypothetical protein